VTKATQPVEQERLRLAEFRVLYRHWSIGLLWFDRLLFGLLVWMEGKMIDNRANVEVDEALKEYKLLQPDNIVPPVYTERPSDTSTRLPEMRLTASWYTDIYDEK